MKKGTSAAFPLRENGLQFTIKSLQLDRKVAVTEFVFYSMSLNDKNDQSSGYKFLIRLMFCFLQHKTPKIVLILFYSFDYYLVSSRNLLGRSKLIKGPMHQRNLNEMQIGRNGKSFAQ